MELELPSGQIVVYDNEDHTLLSAYKWYAKKGSTRKGVEHYYARGRIKSEAQVYMHRVVMHIEHVSWKLIKVDHINQNGLDNRKSNLRLTDHSHNRAYINGLQFNNSSGFHGVDYHKATSKWQARIQVNGKRIYLGIFSNSEDAAKAYDIAAVNYFGSDFAYLNFPT